MQLSPNFRLSEFTTSAGIVIRPTPEQIFCISVLCENILQPVRNIWGPVKITSGLRNQRSYLALKKKGYPASETSDHFAWGTVNPKGTGAADFVVSGAKMKEVFHWLIDQHYKHAGQIIYYPKKNFIHVSNHPNEIFKMKDTRPEENRVLTYSNGKFKPYPRRPTNSWSNP